MLFAAVANYIIANGASDLIINYGTAGIVSNKDILVNLYKSM